MKIAWKEMKKNKSRYLIVGSIVLLISLVTFIISGLANGLSQDNVSLIKNMPDGTFYMSEDANESFTQSRINASKQQILNSKHDAFAFSIQMGSLKNESDNQQSVAFLTSTDTPLLKQVNEGEVILDSGLKAEGIEVGDELSSPLFDGTFKVIDFVDNQTFNHSPAALISQETFEAMFRTDEWQLLYLPDTTETISGLQSYSKKEFLSTIPSYQAEQMTLNMIVWFLVVISGMLFGIFFYMMNVQKVGMYGILKALGIKTSVLFKMMWSQMALITIIALLISTAISQVFQYVAPESMPYHLTLTTTLQLSLVFAVVGFIGSTLSGFQIKKIDPLQAIQQGEA